MSRFVNTKRICRMVACLAAILVLLILAGCARGMTTSSSFTPEWTWELERLHPKESQPPPEGIAIGNKAKPLAHIKMDEKGRPQLEVGGKSHVSADIDVDSDEAKMDLKYKREWGPKRMRAPRTKSGTKTGTE